jgi:hypothetical protein
MAERDFQYGHGLDPLDPMTRQAAQLAGPTSQNHAPMTDPSQHALSRSPINANADDALPPRAKVSMEDLLPQLVRRIAWAGDRKKGTVQLELGAGRHAGTLITVHADDGRVRVELDGHGPEVDALRSRIATRLKHRGVNVESVS